MADTAREILVVGATGSQGRAAARHLRRAGLRVRGLTRNPSSPAAKALSAAGVTVVRGDLDDRAAVEAAIRGVDGVYLVTDFFQNGIAGEVRHGKLVADLCAELGVGHLVVGSVSGADRESGVPHFESKAEIERHVRSLGLAATVLRPAIFMEDLTDRHYVPPASWGMMPKLIGADRPVKWISVDDIGAAVAAVCANPADHVGAAIPLVGDVRSMADTRALFTRIRGKQPLALPMPTFLFRRFVSDDLVRMWTWLATHEMDGDVATTRALVPGVRTFETWLAG